MCQTHLSFKGIDKRSSNEFSLLLWISDPLEAGVEFLRRVDYGKVDTKVLLFCMVSIGRRYESADTDSKILLNLLPLIQPHQTVINQDGLEAISDGLVHQLCSDGRVNAAANSTEDLALGSDKLSDAGNFLFDKVGHGPVLLRFADIDREVLQQLGAIGGVCRSLARLTRRTTIRYTYE